MKIIKKIGFILSISFCIILLLPTAFSLAANKSNNQKNLHDFAFSDEVPDYYQDHLSAKIKEIIDLENYLNINGQDKAEMIRFVWFTDYHFDPNEYLDDPTHGHCNTKNSPALMKEILKYTGINRILFGGDIATSYSCYRGQQYLIDCLLDFKESFRFAEDILFSVNGNHEYFCEGDPLSYSQMTTILRNSIVRNAHAVDPYGDYSISDDLEKVFYVMINSQNDVYHYRPDLITDEQIHFLFSQLCEVPNGYSVIIVTHALLRYDGIVNGLEKWTPYPSAEKIFSGISSFAERSVHFFDSETYDFSMLNADIVCCLAGHSHLDTEYILPCGIPVIQTTCDTVRKRDFEYDRDSETMVKATECIGTYREQAFDVVTIDRKTHKIYLTRIGDEGMDCAGYHKENGDRSLYYPLLMKN